MRYHLRLIAVLLSLFVFAAVFAGCGGEVAYACSDDVCCEESVEADRLRDNSARIVKAIGDSLTQTPLVAHVMTLSPRGTPSEPKVPIPLAWKVARLRI